jgi:hypothetical protein
VSLLIVLSFLGADAPQEVAHLIRIHSTIRRVTEVADRMVAKWDGTLANGGRLKYQ